AMNAVKGLFADESRNFTIKSEPNPASALEILFNQQYIYDKERIMKPIAEFRIMMDKRISLSIEMQKAKNSKLIIGIILLTAMVFLLSVYAIKLLRQNLLQQNEELDAKIKE